MDTLSPDFKVTHSNSVCPEPESPEYLMFPTEEQAAILRRWHGHIRSVHNAAYNFFREENSEPNTALGKLLRYISQSKFLMELPSSALGEKVAFIVDDWEEFIPGNLASRKQDLQVIGLHGQDFEVTERATVVVAGLGELDIEFTEGPPRQDPVSIELIHDPLAQHADAIRLYYKGAANNG